MYITIVRGLMGVVKLINDMFVTHVLDVLRHVTIPKTVNLIDGRSVQQLMHAMVACTT